MKEKNLKRKMELKRRRQKLLLKKTLRNDIGKFLSDFWMLQVQHPISYVNVLLFDGFKGFNNMRGKDLLGHFDEAYRDLRDKKKIIEFYWRRINWESDSDRKIMNQKDTDNERERLHIDSDSLMSRVMELAFDLDIEE